MGPNPTLPLLLLGLRPLVRIEMNACTAFAQLWTGHAEPSHCTAGCYDGLIWRENSNLDGPKLFVMRRHNSSVRPRMIILHRVFAHKRDKAPSRAGHQGDMAASS